MLIISYSSTFFLCCIVFICSVVSHSWSSSFVLILKEPGSFMSLKDISPWSSSCLNKMMCNLTRSIATGAVIAICTIPRSVPAKAVSLDEHPCAQIFGSGYTFVIILENQSFPLLFWLLLLFFLQRSLLEPKFSNDNILIPFDLQ